MKNIAITAGDLDGIGPEILNKLIEQKCFEELEKYGFSFEFYVEKNCFSNLELAVENCKKGIHKGIVTGPINKEKWHKAGHQWNGQTEYLAHATNTQNAEMVFMIDYEENKFSLSRGLGGFKAIKILLLTRHIPLNQVVEKITFERLEQAVHNIRNFKGNECSIAMASINPHGGENGAIGTEESEYLNSWCKKLNITGTVSPDKLWFDMAQNYLNNREQEFDFFIAPYHDQILPLIKTITNLKAVNVTLGLPFIRTSPDHGTAYDLVGTGKADIEPFWEAIKMCCKLA